MVDGVERRKEDNPVRVEQLLLCLDGLRYSCAIALACHERARALLRTFEPLSPAGAPTKDVMQVVADVWSMIDATHRIRRLIGGAPLLPKKAPAFRIFTQGTGVVESLRNYVQHIDNEIGDRSGTGQPVWGTISWVSESDPLTHLSLFTGSHHLRASVAGIAFDTQELRFARTFELNAGSNSVDLDNLADRVRELDGLLAGWANAIVFADGQRYSYRPPANMITATTVRLMTTDELLALSPQAGP
jgi:hypothetical protein